MKKILLFIDSIGSGGAQNQLVCLAKLLKVKGYDVKMMVVYSEYDFFRSSLEDSDIICDPSSKGMVNRLINLPRIIKRQHPDVVIAYLDSQCIIACIAKIMANFKLIVSERNTSQELTFREKVKFLLYRLADYIVPNSFSQEDFIKDNYPNLLNKVHVITNVIDISRFYPLDKKHKNDVPQIISVGRNTFQKNYLGMIETVKILKEKGVKAHFNWYAAIYKSDDYYKKVEKRIKDYGLSDMISIFKPTNEIGDKYRESDFFWIASYYEGFPNVLCEAMMCGLPVAFSNVCDNPKIAKDGENGVMFSPDNPEEMAEKLIKLITMPDSHLVEISKRNVARIKELCSEDTFIGKYVNLIEN